MGCHNPATGCHNIVKRLAPRVVGSGNIMILDMRHHKLASRYHIGEHDCYME